MCLGGLCCSVGALWTRGALKPGAGSSEHLPVDGPSRLMLDGGADFGNGADFGDRDPHNQLRQKSRSPDTHETQAESELSATSWLGGDSNNFNFLGGPWANALIP